MYIERFSRPMRENARELVFELINGERPLDAEM